MTPSLLLHSLGSDKKVRRAVAQHKKTPAVALNQMCDDKDDKVRRADAQHKKTPQVARVLIGLM